MAIATFEVNDNIYIVHDNTEEAIDIAQGILESYTIAKYGYRKDGQEYVNVIVTYVADYKFLCAVFEQKYDQSVKANVAAFIAEIVEGGK